ncbi:MAG: hypothetical protein NZ866_00420 [Patescibacteria group bacterium]|nr:hypothetical protein [Patescibacteria group bacterium]
MKRDKNFFILFFLFSFLYFSHFNSTFAEKYENINLLSLNLQSYVNQFKNKFKKFFFSSEETEYKEKYYNLLRNIAQLKLAEQEKTFSESLDLLKKRYPSARETKVFTNHLGIIYTQPLENIEEKAFAVDSNWLLIGKFIERNEKYLKIVSLNYVGFQLNVSNLDGEYLGLAKSSGLGYLILDRVDPKVKLEEGDLVLTTGNDGIFPAGFLVGEIIEIETKGYIKKAKIRPLANFESEKLIILQ